MAEGGTTGGGGSAPSVTPTEAFDKRRRVREEKVASLMVFTSYIESVDEIRPLVSGDMNRYRLRLKDGGVVEVRSEVLVSQGKFRAVWFNGVQDREGGPSYLSISRELYGAFVEHIKAIAVPVVDDSPSIESVLVHRILEKLKSASPTEDREEALSNMNLYLANGAGPNVMLYPYIHLLQVVKREGIKLGEDPAKRLSELLTPFRHEPSYLKTGEPSKPVRVFGKRLRFAVLDRAKIEEALGDD